MDKDKSVPVEEYYSTWKKGGKEALLKLIKSKKFNKILPKKAD